MNQPSESLLRNVVDGNQEAFAELYNYYRTPALRFCVALLKDQEEAENALHEVFIKIWEKRSHIKPDLNFNSYLFTCLRNFIFDHFKRMEKDQRLRELYMERMGNGVTLEETENRDARELFVRDVIANLSEKRKQVVLLTVYEGKSYQEIAGVMKISKNTVKNQLVKAKQILREQLVVVYS